MPRRQPHIDFVDMARKTGVPAREIERALKECGVPRRNITPEKLERNLLLFQEMRRRIATPTP